MNFRKKLDVRQLRVVTMSDGRPAVQSVCLACRTRVSQIVSREEPLAVPRGARLSQDCCLDYFADSPDFIAQTIDASGYRERLCNAVQKAIAMANWPVGQS